MHHEAQNRTANFRWNAEISRSTSGSEWFPTDPADLFAYVTGDGEVTQALLSDTTVFRAPMIRLNLACSNGAGTARESATVSLWVLFVFQT